MTTLEPYRGLELLLARLDRVRGRWLLVSSAVALAGLVAVVLGVLAVMGLAAGFWPDQPPPVLRWALLAGAIAALTAAIFWLVVLPIRRRPNPAQTARLVESRMGGFDNGLINALLLADDSQQRGPLVQCAIDETVRLAGKQAQLLNKAERIQGGMKVSDYSNFQFLQAVTLMRQVQGDLEHFRYNNALRQRQVTLGALEKTQLLLSGKVEVTTDASGNMPKYVQDDITDAMKSKLPAEFRDVLMKYFTRLGETGGEKKP